MRTLLLLIFLFFTFAVQGQKYISESSKISFYSRASIEDIAADNTKSLSMFNAETSEVAFSVPIREFKFAKSLMEEHFNEKYLETEKYPKSTFQGKIVDFQPQLSGVQQVKAQGKFTLHGVTKDIEVPGILEMANGKVMMKSKFKVKLIDYNIARPKLLWQNIADEIEVTIDFIFKPYEK